jgi:hypothetical protein
VKYWQLIRCMAVAGLTLLAVGAAFHFAIPMVAPDIPTQFLNAALFRPWSGWTSTYMFLHPLGYGVVFALIYAALWRRGFGGWRGGLRFGFGVFLVGALPVWLLAYASFSVSPEVMAWFVLQAAFQYLAAGAAIGAVAAYRAEPLNSLEHQ